MFKFTYEVVNKKSHVNDRSELKLVVNLKNYH